MQIHLIQHAPFENPGAIMSWAIERGYPIRSTHTYKGEKLPNLSEIGFLIVMGGPQSTRELDKYPYLRDEIALIQQAIHHKKTVLGICLGAQLIAESLGAKTEPSPNKEIGFFPVELTNEAQQDPIFGFFPNAFDVMHWHSDMPAIPAGAVLLAASKGCPRQAIRYGDRVYALQFHMEMTQELVQSMIENCAGDLKPGDYVQEPSQLRDVDFTELNKKMYRVLDYLSALAK